jgi:2-polyprenyl-3-methyl-5-hydroxy-6-metoxy-1,4-benzoquinol methylase
MRENVHIPYDFKIQPYHKIAADLVCQYCENERPAVLDLGCGVGHTLNEISKRMPEAEFTAVDIDDECLDITGQRVKLKSKIKVTKTEDIYDLPTRYDALIMSHSLEHMYNPVETIQSVMKLLNPGGILVLAVPNPVRMQVILFNLLRRHYVNKGHVFAWDRSHFMNFLENILSLNVLCYREDYFRLPFSHRLPFLRPIELLLVKIFPWFSSSHIAVVKK